MVSVGFTLSHKSRVGDPGEGVTILPTNQVLWKTYVVEVTCVDIRKWPIACKGEFSLHCLLLPLSFHFMCGFGLEKIKKSSPRLILLSFFMYFSAGYSWVSFRRWWAEEKMKSVGRRRWTQCFGVVRQMPTSTVLGSKLLFQFSFCHPQISKWYKVFMGFHMTLS